jgi:hypothetical protein
MYTLMFGARNSQLLRGKNAPVLRLTTCGPSSSDFCRAISIAVRSFPCSPRCIGALRRNGGAARRRYAQVLCHSAQRYHSVRRAGRRRDLATAGAGHPRAVDAARSNLAADRRRRTIFRASGYGRAPNLFYGTDVSVVVPPTISSRAGACIRRPFWGSTMVVGFKPLLFCAVSVTSPRLALADALRV